MIVILLKLDGPPIIVVFHAFPNAHPSMSEFVSTIRRISTDKLSIRSTSEWLREGSRGRCISQLIFSQFQLLTIPLLMLLQFFEQYNICNQTIAANFELYVYTLDSVLKIDIIFPTPFMN